MQTCRGTTFRIVTLGVKLRQLQLNHRLRRLVQTFLRLRESLLVKPMCASTLNLLSGPLQGHLLVGPVFISLFLIRTLQDQDQDQSPLNFLRCPTAKRRVALHRGGFTFQRPSRQNLAVARVYCRAHPEWSGGLSLATSSWTPTLCSMHILLCRDFMHLAPSQQVVAPKTLRARQVTRHVLMYS
jgi:hypothetical protein